MPCVAPWHRPKPLKQPRESFQKGISPRKARIRAKQRSALIHAKTVRGQYGRQVLERTRANCRHHMAEKSEPIFMCHCANTIFEPELPSPRPYTRRDAVGCNIKLPFRLSAGGANGYTRGANIFRGSRMPFSEAPDYRPATRHRAPKTSQAFAGRKIKDDR